MAGEKKEDPFAGFTDHTADQSDPDGNPVVADNDAEGGNDTAIDNDADEADDDGQDNSQKEMNLGEEEDPDTGPDELEDDSDDDADEEEGGEDEGDDSDKDDPDNIEDDPDDDADDDPEPKAKKKRSVKERISEFRKRTGNAERRADTAEARLAQSEARIAKLEADLTPGSKDGSADADDDFGLTRPDPNDYKYGEMDTKYQDELTDYKVDLKLAKRDAQNETAQQETAAQEAAQGLMETYDGRVVDGIKAYDDFEKVVVEAADEGEFPLGETVGMLALNSDVGHHVLYKIASDLELAKKLDAMSPAAAGREFGRLEAQFDTRTPRKSKKKRTNTTPPASRRRGGKAGSGRTKGNTQDFAAFEAQATADENARLKR